MNKGDISSCITLIIMIAGVSIKVNNDKTHEIVDYIVAFGLFGFAGGLTNWLAVKMLFDTVKIGPLALYGSGVIPSQFKEIRRAVKNMVS